MSDIAKTLEDLGLPWGRGTVEQPYNYFTPEGGGVRVEERAGLDCEVSVLIRKDGDHEVAVSPGIELRIVEAPGYAGFCGNYLFAPRIGECALYVSHEQ